MSKFAGFIIGAVEIGIGIATRNVALIVSGAAMIVSQAIVDLTAPKQPAREASEMTIALGEQPRVMLVGETFTPGSLVDGFDYDGKYGTDWEVLLIRLADHKCRSLTGFYVNDTYVLYAGDGAVAGYNGQLKLYFRADTSTDPLPAIVTSHGPGWTAADIGRSGCDVIVAYKADKKDAKNPIWPSGRPRFGFVVKGALCYDPRLDDTVAGGAGPHRWNDSSTWEWSENAAICRYKWVRGVYADDAVTNPTALLVGRGLTATEAPPANIIAAANLCDEIHASIYPYQSVATAEVYTAMFARGGPYMTVSANGSASSIEWWNMLTRTNLGVSTGGDAASGSVANVAMASDGTAYNFGIYFVGLDVRAALYVTPPLGSTTKIESNSSWYGGPTRVFDLAGDIRKVLTATYGANQYVDYETAVPVTYGRSLNFCIDDGGVIFGLFVTPSSNAFTIAALDGSEVINAVGTVVRGSGTLTGAIAYDAAHARFVVATDGRLYGVTRASGALAYNVAFAGSTRNFPANDPGSTSFWSGYTEIALADGSTIRTVTPGNWTGEDSGSGTFFDPLNHALIAHPQFLAHLTWRFLDRNGGYRVAGPIYSDQEFIDVEGMFAAATGGSTITVEGSVELEPGHAKSVVATFTDDDLVVGSKVTWNEGFLSQSSNDWVNTVVANYIEPDQRWNPHDAPPARVNADIVADGKAREAALKLRLVRHIAQALRVAEIARRLGRVWGRGTVTLGPRFCEVEDGDWVSWQSARRFGGGSKTFRVEAYSIDKKWQNTLTLREISAEVYADDATFSLDKSLPTTTVPPPQIGAPAGANWALAATTLTSSGASVPALQLTGTAADDDQAQAIIVEYWKSDGITDPTTNPDAIPWTTSGTYSPDTAEVPITSVVGGATYYAAVSYVVDGIPGDRLVLGPVIVGSLDVSGQALLKMNNLSDVASPAASRVNLGLGTAAVAALDIDGTMAANSDTSVPSQKAVRTYVASKLVGMFDLRGTTDCSGNPNYPAAIKGDTYVVTVAGKIGGAAGASVSIGDAYFATADNAGGTQAAVGASWDTVIHSGSLAGALLAALNLSDLASPSAARSNLGLLRLVAFFFTTAPSSSEVLAVYTAVDAFTIAANMSGTQVKVGTNPAATFAIDVQLNGATIGTISIAATGVVTLTTTGGTSKAIVAGDVLKFVAPASADASIANVAVNVKGIL